MASRPTPDDAADALAVAVCVANRIGQPSREGAGVLDRGASAPIERGSTPYERAVRDALAREKRPAKASAS
jgi:hypothetical protein